MRYIVAVDVTVRNRDAPVELNGTPATAAYAGVAALEVEADTAVEAAAAGLERASTTLRGA